ncbi:MAG: LysR family transcriptional regulator [Eubacteriales bacterium]|nr:LysR family transcriptional regulator [Eubacteriales bacterium]
MEIRNLITFVQVAELSSFTKAAKALDYSQSTVSFQIKQLETELDCLLFERINHTLILTDRGRELLAYAQEVCRLTDEFHERRAESAEPRGHVHLLTPDSVCEAMLLENYSDFHRRYPGITMKFSTADTATMFSMLDHNEADAMLTLDSHVYHKDYIIAKEAPMPVHFVAGRRSPLRGRAGLTIRDLLAEPFILTEKGMGYRKSLDNALARLSLELQPVLEISRTDIITNLVAQGDAISFLPDFVTRAKVDSGDLYHLDVRDMTVDIWQQLIYHRSKWISRALDTFLQYVAEKEFSR